jgi:hypothetical protein
MGITKVKAIELIFDWNLWPRQSAQRLDSTNLTRMKATLKSGFALPPVIVNKQDYRIVDGFHRTRSILDVYGDDAEIDVEFREYLNEAAMFLDAGALNAYHGLTMSPKDRAHFFIKARRMKIPSKAIAEALHIDVESLTSFIEKRTAKTEAGETIPLSAGARNLAGKTLTPVQEHFAHTANGCMPEMYISMLINALNADSVFLTDKTMARLKELHRIIEAILEEAA